MLARWSILAVTLAILAGTLLSIAPIRAFDQLERGSCPVHAEQDRHRFWMEELRAPAKDRGFLWRISKGGHTSYLYGTVHIAKPSWTFLGRTVRAAFDASDRLAVEVDLTDPDVKQRVAKSLGAPENNLPLPDPLLKRIQTFAERVCFPLSDLDKTPLALKLSALARYMSMYDGLYTAFGIDASLSELARDTGKPVVSLENPETRIRVDDASDRIVLPTEAIEGLETGRTRELGLRGVEVWAESRYDDFLRYKEWCECFDTDAKRRYWSRATEDRNRIQALAIDALHEMGHNVFAAVGYAHMVGDRGLPSLLEQMGYQVEFVVFAKGG
jgi:uncharacterized protein YbaP (TraB family)